MEKDSQHLADAPNPSSGFTVDFYVVLEPVTGPKGRLQTRLLGPYQVIGNKGNSYTLLNLVTKKEFITNVSRMVPFILTLTESTLNQSLHTNPTNLSYIVSSRTKETSNKRNFFSRYAG